jgi:hypothetical protein
MICTKWKWSLADFCRTRMSLDTCLQISCCCGGARVTVTSVRADAICTTLVRWLVMQELLRCPKAGMRFPPQLESGLCSDSRIFSWSPRGLGKWLLEISYTENCFDAWRWGGGYTLLRLLCRPRTAALIISGLMPYYILTSNRNVLFTPAPVDL